MTMYVKAVCHLAYNLKKKEALPHVQQRYQDEPL